MLNIVKKATKTTNIDGKMTWQATVQMILELHKQKKFIEKLLAKSNQLKRMVGELRRYRIVGFPVVGITCAVLTLLGWIPKDSELLENGLPTKDNKMALQKIWKSTQNIMAQTDLIKDMENIELKNVELYQINVCRAILNEITATQASRGSQVIHIMREWVQAVVEILGVEGRTFGSGENRPRLLVRRSTEKSKEEEEAAVAAGDGEVKADSDERRRASLPSQPTTSK